MAKLVVSTWTRDHIGHQYIKESTHRLNKLRRAVAVTQALVDKTPVEPLGLIKGIFAPPEYFFANRYAGMEMTDGSMQPRGVDVTERNDLLDRLTDLSFQHRRILIIPGTIVWERPFKLQKLLAAMSYYGTRVNYVNAGEAQQTELICDWWYYRKGTRKLICATDLQEERRVTGLPIPIKVLLPEDVARIRKLKPNLYAEMRQYAMLVREVGLGEVASFKKRMEAGAAPLQYMMSNAAYGFLNGEVVFMYSKQANFNEEVGDTSLIFKPGGRNGVRDIEGTRFGIEICLDHDIGMLSRQARPDRPIDIQVVLSDAVQRKAESLSALRDKGWLIHAATAAPENGVWHKTPT